MPTIWFQDKKPSLDDVRARGRGTMLEHVGIELTAIGDDYIEGTMPVDHRTRQPLGLLHGGASMVLAETLGSIAAAIVVDRDAKYCVGLEINGNHLRSATGGVVTGRATPIHIGGKTQVWEIRITQDSKMICISRLTMAVLDKPAGNEKPKLKDQR